MSIESWQTALGEIPDIIAAEPSKDKAILLAALLALQSHFDRQGQTAHSAPKTAAQGENEAAESILTEYMEDELQDAEKYLKLWHETSDKDFKDIAKQELSHFEILAKHARTIDPNIDLNPYMVHHNALLARLV